MLARRFSPAGSSDRQLHRRKHLEAFQAPTRRRSVLDCLRCLFHVFTLPRLCVGVVYCRRPYFCLCCADPVVPQPVNHIFFFFTRRSVQNPFLVQTTFPAFRLSFIKKRNVKRSFLYAHPKPLFFKSAVFASAFEILLVGSASPDKSLDQMRQKQLCGCRKKSFQLWNCFHSSAR